MKQQLKGQFLALSLSALLMTGVVATVAAIEQAPISTVSTPPSILAFDQKLEGSHVLLEYAYLPEKGYAVIYGANKDGNPIRESLGHIELAAGDHRKFKIKLDKAPPVGSTLWVSLYTDKDGKAGFDKTADASIWNDELPLENRFVVR